MTRGSDPITGTIYRMTGGGKHDRRIATPKDMQEGLYLVSKDGLTKREYFAGLVMQGFAAGPEGENATIEGFAKYAVKWADALIDALNKEHS